MAQKTHNLPDGRTISYILQDEPTAAPIVLLANSLCAPLAAWDLVVKVLNDNGFRTLRYDQPGHGASTVPKDLASTTFDLLVDDVHALLRALKIEKLYAWIGISMGAATSIYFVAKHPGVVRKLAICDTISCSPGNAGVDDPFGPRVAAARQAGSLEAITQQTLERWFGKEWLAAQPGDAARLREIMSGTTLDGFETCCNAIKSDTFDARPLFGKVGAGVDDALLVVGEKDANLPQTMEEMRQKVQAGFDTVGKARSIELKVIPRAGHVCYIDGFDDFRAIILEFLRR